MAIKRVFRALRQLGKGSETQIMLSTIPPAAKHDYEEVNRKSQQTRSWIKAWSLHQVFGSLVTT